MILSRLLISSVCLLAISWQSSLHAAGNGSGPESVVVVGHVLEVLPDGVLVYQKNGGHKRYLKITGSSQVRYISFTYTPDGKVSVPKPGYGVKAKVQKGDIVSGVTFSPPLPKQDRPIKDRKSHTARTLFEKVDHDNNGAVDYVELSLAVGRDEKHGPDHYRTADADKSDGLDLKEFETILARKLWWRYSRKTPEAWLKDADKNQNGSLNEAEFLSIAKSKKTPLSNHDQDQSGSICFEELKAYLTRKMVEPGQTAPEKIKRTRPGKEKLNKVKKKKERDENK